MNREGDVVSIAQSFLLQAILTSHVMSVTAGLPLTDELWDSNAHGVRAVAELTQLRK